MTRQISNIHDTFFRETMSHKDVAADFLRSYLPKNVLAHLRLDTLAICKDTFVGADQAGHYSALCGPADWRQPGIRLFPLRAQSYPDHFVSLQLLRYLLEIWELYRKQHRGCQALPLIIPVVVYHKTPQRGIPLAELIILPDTELACYVPNFDITTSRPGRISTSKDRSFCAWSCPASGPTSLPLSDTWRTFFTFWTPPRRQRHVHALGPGHFPLSDPAHGHQPGRGA